MIQYFSILINVTISQFIHWKKDCVETKVMKIIFTSHSDPGNFLSFLTFILPFFEITARK